MKTDATQECPFHAAPAASGDTSGETRTNLSVPGGPSQAGPLRTIDQLPGPKGHPVVGNALQIVPAKMHLQLEDWAALYGPIYRLRLGRQRVLVVSDAKLMEGMLRARPKTFRRWSKSAEIM